MARLRRSRGTRDQGTSLVEMLVTMALLTIVIAATITFIIGFTRTNAKNVSLQDQVDTGRSASQMMTKTLRTAVMPSQLTASCTACTEDAFVLGQDYAVQFYANINNPGNTVGPSRVTYTVATSGPNAGDLVEKVQQPDSNVPTATVYAYCAAEQAGASAACKGRLATRILAKGVQFTTSTPLFQYYDANGTRLVPPTGGGLTVADLGKVLQVELTVKVQAQSASRMNATTYIQRITLPNAQAVLRQSEETTP